MIKIRPDISQHLENYLRQTDCHRVLEMIKYKSTGKSHKKKVIVNNCIGVALKYY